MSAYWTALVVVFVILVFWFFYRSRKHNRQLDFDVAQLCRDYNAPNTEFDLDAAISQVMLGTRPGLVDGRWWVATGIEQVADRTYTRVLREYFVDAERDVEAAIDELFSVHGENVNDSPVMNEGQYAGSLAGHDGGIVHARVTGKWRPIGGWLVAIPPWLVNSNSHL